MSFATPVKPGKQGTRSFAWTKARMDASAWTARRDPLTMLAGITGAADCIVIFALSLVAFMLRHGIEPVPLEIMSTSFFAALLTINALSIGECYGARLKDGFGEQIWRVAQVWTVVFLLLLTIAYITKS